MDNLRVGEVICNILTSDKELRKYVGDKVFPLVANEETTFPFIAYKRVNTTPASSKDRYVYSYDCEIEIMVIADDYDEGLEIASLIGNTLPSRKGTIAGVNVKEITYDGDSEDYLECAFIQDLRFKIKIV